MTLDNDSFFTNYHLVKVLFDTEGENSYLRKPSNNHKAEFYLIHFQTDFSFVKSKTQVKKIHFLGLYIANSSAPSRSQMLSRLIDERTKSGFNRRLNFFRSI